jgi:hypothetical protein
MMGLEPTTFCMAIGRPFVPECRHSIFTTSGQCLLALSSLARHPGTWAKATDPDSSSVTVPLEKGLRLARMSCSLSFTR